MKEIKINIPEDCKIDKIKNTDDTLTIIFKEVKPTLPKTWQEFCGMFPIKESEAYINDSSLISYAKVVKSHNARRKKADKNLLPDHITAETILILCQLIQLRNCYNGDWIPNWKKSSIKFTIEFNGAGVQKSNTEVLCSSPLYFKTEELRDEFLYNFRDLIEKLKPLYGIKEGGEE